MFPSEFFVFCWWLFCFYVVYLPVIVLFSRLAFLVYMVVGRRRQEDNNKQNTTHKKKKKEKQSRKRCWREMVPFVGHKTTSSYEFVVRPRTYDLLPYPAQPGVGRKRRKEENEKRIKRSRPQNDRWIRRRFFFSSFFSEREIATTVGYLDRGTISTTHVKRVHHSLI